MALIDLRNSIIKLLDGGSNSLEIKIGEGNLTYTEKRQIDVVKSRGALDTIRQNEDEPMEVSFSFMWEFITSASGEPVTIEDALKQRNGASTWLSACPDTAAPYSVNIEVYYTPICPGVKTETILLPQFNQQQLAHSLRDATVACNGLCNAVAATVIRA